MANQDFFKLNPWLSMAFDNMAFAVSGERPLTIQKSELTKAVAAVVGQSIVVIHDGVAEYVTIMGVNHGVDWDEWPLWYRFQAVNSCCVAQ